MQELLSSFDPNKDAEERRNRLNLDILTSEFRERLTLAQVEFEQDGGFQSLGEVTFRLTNIQRSVFQELYNWVRLRCRELSLASNATFEPRVGEIVEEGFIGFGSANFYFPGQARF